MLRIRWSSVGTAMRKILLPIILWRATMAEEMGVVEEHNWLIVEARLSIARQEVMVGSLFFRLRQHSHVRQALLIVLGRQKRGKKFVSLRNLPSRRTIPIRLIRLPKSGTHSLRMS